jgi:hypothetical protein
MVQWRKDRELHWRGVLQRQAESGLNVAEFCRRNSISGPSFYSWKRKLKERDAGLPQENQPTRSQTVSAGQLLPVRIESTDPPEPMRILMPRGLSLDVPSGTDPSVLTDLLRALRETHLC